MLVPCALLWASLALADPLPSAPGPSQETQDEVKDRTLERAWRRASDEDKREVVAWFRAEVDYLRTFQAGLVKFLVARQERAPKNWPEGTDEVPIFDPKVHAPAQPIERRVEDDRSARRFRDKVLGEQPERHFDAIWSYDYVQGVPVRRGELDDPDRVFANAVKGMHPDLDYAEALLEQMLDDGSLRKTHLAFSHAYSDREGKVVPGITLYDVWASGLDMEMPDVECLGIIHLVEDDWRTWRAPVPAGRQSSLYERLGEHFSAIHRQRSLNRTLARVYLSAQPAVPRGWDVYVDRFHAFWDRHSSDPAQVAALLPPSDTWETWLETLTKEVESDPDLWSAGLRRRATLDADRAAIRATLVYVLREYGLLER